MEVVKWRGGWGGWYGGKRVTHVVDAEEAECHHVGTPLGPGAAGAAAGRDAAAVEHDGHVVGALGLASLLGHHGGAEVEACDGGAHTSGRAHKDTHGHTRAHTSDRE